jgi:hypothetical protein
VLALGVAGFLLPGCPLRRDFGIEALFLPCVILHPLIERRGRHVDLVQLDHAFYGGARDGILGFGGAQTGGLLCLRIGRRAKRAKAGRHFRHNRSAASLLLVMAIHCRGCERRRRRLAPYFAYRHADGFRADESTNMHAIPPI